MNASPLNLNRMLNAVVLLRRLYQLWVERQERIRLRLDSGALEAGCLERLNDTHFPIKTFGAQIDEFNVVELILLMFDKRMQNWIDPATGFSVLNSKDNYLEILEEVRW